jgi:non-heme chloroperoxidase
LAVKLLKNGRLITYKDLPHGLCQTHPDIVNADLLAFIREEAPGAEPKIEVHLVEPPVNA